MVVRVVIVTHILERPKLRARRKLCQLCVSGTIRRMSVEIGLRERKKQRTRELISDTARKLFAERGFERVSVAEIARAAEVSGATVFNYFPTKEDLVFSGFEAF